MTQNTATRNAQINKVTALLKEAYEDIETTRAENSELSEVNVQLHKDLETCRNHLQNVNRNNSSVNQELESYQKVNRIAIKKLENPSESHFYRVPDKKGLEDARTGEGFFEHSL